MLTAHEAVQLDRLIVGATVRTEAAAHGRRIAIARGQGLDVSDHRPYQGGDDPRHIDWNAEARLRQLSVRVMKAEANVQLHLVLDISASMSTKLTLAGKLAAAIGYVVSAERGAVGLSLVSDNVRLHVPAARGHAQRRVLFEHLAGAAAVGRTALDQTLTSIAFRVRPPGLVVVLSDFLVAGFGISGLHAVTARGLECAAIQLLADDELQPAVEDGVRVIDMETGEEARANRAHYAQRLSHMTGALVGECRQRRISFLQMRASTPFSSALEALVRAGIIRVQ